MTMCSVQVCTTEYPAHVLACAHLGVLSALDTSAGSEQVV